MNKNQIKDVPKDTIQDGIVIAIDKCNWKMIVPADKLHKFENPDEEVLVVKYETKYNDSNLKGEDTIRYYAEPFPNSNLGKFLTKYDNLEVGSKVKVTFDGNGFSSIKLD